MAKTIWALGAMSGTSLDGVDAAMLLTDGERIAEFGPQAYRPYTEIERATIRAAFGKWPDQAGVTAAAKVVETAHAEVLARFSGAELIGFHGQTLAHDPAHGRTHQAGDGRLLARVLGVPVVYDFRSMDVELGGQGAPLVPYFHHALARYLGLTRPVAMLNLGGVGNITWIDPKAGVDQVLAFDTGPANAPINDLIMERLGLAQDTGGALAKTGQVDEYRVQTFLTQSYFAKMPPKSLDRDAFDYGFTEKMQTPDAIATLTAIAAASVARAAEHFPAPVDRLLVAGGGRLNTALMDQLRHRLNITVQNIDETGLNGDMIEAQAFAYLAVRVRNGLATSGPNTTGVATQISGGLIARPDQALRR